ncbi:MAG: hypothetical protein AAF541_17155 [Pseudomonadota bacterium]
MKKVLMVIGGVIAVLAALVFLFRDGLLEFAADQLTKDMYVAADTDTFDPALEIGAQFPRIEALHNNEVLQDVAQLPMDKGMIFVANRSVDW